MRPPLGIFVLAAAFAPSVRAAGDPLDSALAKASAKDGVKIALVAEAPEAALGGEIVLRVAVANASDTAVTVNELRLDELSVAFETRLPGLEPFEYCELACLPGGDTLALKREAIPSGKDLRETFRLPAILSGKTTFTARYFGFGDPEGEGLSSAPVEVEVKPGEGGATRVAAALETDRGTVVVEFHPDSAPNTVLHFARLVRNGFYDGTVFHRIEPGFVVQGGDPRGNGTGGPEFLLRGEFSERKHVAGTVAMARTDDPDSAGSQFYFTLAPAPHLDGAYTVFGRAADGFEAIVKMAEDPRSRPVLKKAALVPRAAEKAEKKEEKKESGS